MILFKPKGKCEDKDPSKESKDPSHTVVDTDKHPSHVVWGLGTQKLESCRRKKDDHCYILFSSVSWQQNQLYILQHNLLAMYTSISDMAENV